MDENHNQKNNISNGDLVQRFIKPLVIIVPLAIAGNIIYILVASKPGLFKDLGGFNIGYLLLAAIMVFVPWFAHSGRMLLWNRIFKRELRPNQALSTAIGSDLGAALTPTAIGGSYIKLAMLIKYGFSPGEATLVTIIGTIEDGIFFAIAIPVAIIFSGAWNNPYVATAIKSLISHWPLVVAIILILSLATILIGRLKSWKRQTDGIDRQTVSISLMSRFKSYISRYKDDFKTAIKFASYNGKGTFFLCIVVAGIGWCCRYGAISALVLGLGYPVDPILFFLMQWVVFTAMTLIPTPGAIGGAEAAFGIVYNSILPFSIIPLLTGIWRFFTFYLPISAGAIILALMGIKSLGLKKAPNEPEIEEIKA